MNDWQLNIPLPCSSLQSTEGSQATLYTCTVFLLSQACETDWLWTETVNSHFHMEIKYNMTLSGWEICFPTTHQSG